MPFTEFEIHDALNDCGSSRAPGPDGFKLNFFKHHWDLIKPELLDSLNWFWEKGEISNGCNASFITLVPKKSDPIILNDFRPISLIGSYYKILTKVLSNRIKKVIPGLIDEVQSAFIKGRFILNGALIANESIEFLKKNKRKSLIFKVDFEKAFDSLNWDFLLEIMEKMGFGAKWLKWILACLKSASVSVLVNGSPTHEFKLERGIRQGDPLSPFLFIIVAEGLKVNYNKSLVYGLGVTKIEVENLASRIGCRVGEFPFTYLGLPIGRNMNRVENWNPVVEKFKSKLADWKARSISDVSRGAAIDKLGVQLGSSFSKKIGDGNDTNFWDDAWLQAGVLKTICPRLYHLESNKTVSVGERIKWVDGSVLLTWSWSRDLLGRDKDELHHLSNLLFSYVKQDGSSDKWYWNLASNGIFTTKKLSSLIDDKTTLDNRSRSETLKNNLVPGKPEVFIWRVLKKRLPTRIELDKCGIDLHSVRCPICDDDVESFDHALFFCRDAFDTWERMYKWWGFKSTPLLSVNESFRGNSNISMSHVGSKIWQALEWTCAYLIWCNRNKKVFSNTCWNGPTALMEIQLKSFEWISARIKTVKLDWLQWITNPCVYVV
ncbi:uncharacterized protein [Rutidosis leptorrhynchoides]|uniref:uncharacterized protein n=1 Tax=Rutidosis leptorrhynchoides TaxID=125765 RepID=UPI003A99A3B0